MEKPQELADLLETLRPRRMRFALLMALGVVMSIVVAYVLPEVYRATANILIQEPEIPAELTDVYETSAAEQRIAALTRVVMTQENLWQMVEDFNLYPNDRDADSTEEALTQEVLEATLTGQLRRNVYIEPVSEELVHPRTGKATFVTTSFTVSFDYESAETAQQVAERLAQLFLAEDRKSRESRAEDTSAFMAEEAARLRERVTEREQELAVFKRKNINLLPDYVYADRKQIEVVNQQLAQVQRTIASLQDRKSYLQTQLSSNDALAQARAELAAARQKYSEIHPDVVRLRNTIKLLEEGRSQGVVSAYSGEPNDARSVEAQKRYLALQNELQEVNANLRENRMQLSQFQEDLDTLQTNLAEAPEVERQYLALQRSYEHAVEQYDEIRQKVMHAEMAQQLEASDMAGQLMMLRPPLVPVDPISPNRPAIVLLGIIAGFGLCFGYGGIVAYTDRTVRGVRGLTTALKAPPIGVIPYIETTGGLHRKWRAGLTTVIVPITVILSAMFLVQTVWLPFG